MSQVLDCSCSGSIQPAPANLSISGENISLTAGENLVFGDPVYIKSDGKMWKGDANASGKFPEQFLATGTIATDTVGAFLVQGVARNDTWTWTIGGAIYLSTSSGLTQTAPSATDDCIQVLGFALSATTIFFKPSVDYITSV